ncbi:hypothetical protein [Amycolatopsis sp. PS_44_ISF1]|uniref:hypothetical protein n=1 Tax=Amycolatopsis sp. PS_44_ISF1 TaxID=2974917 RepID=UPI0028E0211A|nr:hypothetical protein [Amycolatopsis sp. PS_44_ISF1]MDT8912022.1 hypothetical protein [Amycolatopsis sp. PS_44_ISF1]MDT8913717.1 hypothetical protein [Amycolatopsis sp. PS_44_ISF1]
MTASAAPFDDAFLDALSGEVLPVREVLSALTSVIPGLGEPVPAAGHPAGGGSSSSAVAQAFSAQPDPGRLAVSDGHGSTVYYACATTHSSGTGGVIGLIGLGQPAYTTTTCTPAAITTRY